MKMMMGCVDNSLWLYEWSVVLAVVGICDMVTDRTPYRRLTLFMTEKLKLCFRAFRI